MNYDFRTLNDKDFEELVRDLLNKKEAVNGLFFESFKVGKDQGIDLRYSSVNENQLIIVQSKHYVGSGLNVLLRNLEKNELSKVKRLNPTRYIIATSVPLSPINKKTIYDLFSPYIKELGDILGADEINALLSQFSDIRQQHYKLWFTGVDVLERIIQNGIVGRSEFLESEIRKFYSLYVSVNSTNAAKEVLEQNRFIIVSGIPGVGKTTLSRILIYEYLNFGYKLVCINSDITEGEQRWNNDELQLFWFDDCFGTTTLELVHGRNYGGAMIQFIQRIKNSTNKLLILTSRINILNEAEEMSEVLRHEGIRIAEHQVDIEDLNELQRAKLLYNHLWFNGLPKEYLAVVGQTETYMDIINHENFSPRLIAFITNPTQVKLVDVMPEDYVDFVMFHLKNPQEIWRNAYLYQIGDNERFLLECLFSMSGHFVPEDSLIESYNARIEMELAKNNYKPLSDGFNLAVKKLRDSFLEVHWNADFECKMYRLVQPSLEDFIGFYLANSDSEYKRVLSSVTHGDQLIRLLKMLPGSIPKGHNERKNLLEFIKKKASLGLKEVNPFPNSTLIIHPLEICWIYSQVFSVEEVFDECQKILEVEMEYPNPVDPFRWLYDIMIWASDNINSKEWFINRWDKFILNLFDWAKEMTDHEAVSILYLFEIFELDYKEFYFKSGNRKIIREKITELIEKWNFNIITFQYQHVLEDYDVDRYRSKLYDFISGLHENFILDSSEKEIRLLVEKCMTEHDWQAEMEKQNNNPLRNKEFIQYMNKEFQREMREAGEISDLFRMD
jgi:hypothetical protein